MKNIAERVFTRLPAYLPDLAAVTVRPKTTIIAKSAGAPHELQDALVFVGLTVGIGFLLQAPTLPKDVDFFEAAAAMAAFKVIAILLFSAVVQGLFRLAGGSGGYLRTLTAYLYMVSPLYLALVVLSLIAQGLVRAYDPALGVLVRSNPFHFLQYPEALAAFQREAPALAHAMTAVNSLGNLATLAWFLVCLGAFRHIHGVTRRRSAVAAALIVIAWWPYAAAIFFLAIGMFGPVAPPLT
ncbi:MAG: hypothetical protein Kow00114_39460 [Kiloniellaceae bacterium]